MALTDLTGNTPTSDATPSATATDHAASTSDIVNSGSQAGNFWAQFNAVTAAHWFNDLAGLATDIIKLVTKLI